MNASRAQSLPFASIGERLRSERERSSLTQLDVGKHMGMSRAAISQWESNTSSPSVAQLVDVAKLFSTTPQWLAFGLTGEPRVIHEPPEGSVRVSEVIFGDKPEDVTETGFAFLTSDYLKRELHCLSDNGIILWRIESSDMEPAYEYGSRVIVDTNAKRPSPSGIFLVWDGMGPALRHVNVQPGIGNKAPTARVSIPGQQETYETPADKLSVIGRVRGVMKNI